MPYDLFLDNTPTAEDLGANGGFAEIIEKNLQDARNAIITGNFVGWDYSQESDFFFEDNFDRADEDLTDSSDWTWDGIGTESDTKIISNEVAIVFTGGAPPDAWHMLSSPDTGTTDHFIEWTLENTSSGGSMVCARMTDLNNFIGVRFYSPSGDWHVYERTIATDWNLLGSFSDTPSAGDLCRLEVDGFKARFYLNDVLMVSGVFDSTLISTNCGIFVSDTNNPWVDNVVIAAIKKPTWTKTIESKTAAIWARIVVGANGHPKNAEWYYQHEQNVSPELLIGKETINWDSGESLTDTVWSTALSDSPQIEVLGECDKPIKTDGFLETVDYIRHNSSAIRNDIVCGSPTRGWYAWGVTGTPDMPVFPNWFIADSGVSRLQANSNFYANQTLNFIDWWHFDGTSWRLAGGEAFTYDSNLEVTNITWSGTTAYPNLFLEGKPDSADGADTIILNIKNQLLSLREGTNGLMGIPFWDYSKTDGTGTASQPQYYFWKKSTLWIRITNTWGVGATDSNSIIQQVFDYSENSGVDYDNMGTVVFTYSSPTILLSQTWV